MIHHLLKIFVASIFLCSCSSHISSPTHTVSIARDVNFKLIDLHILNKNISLEQYFSGIYNNQKHSLNIITQISPSKMTVVGLMPIGARAFTMEYDNKNIDFSISKMIPINPKIDQKILAQYVLADMQLVYFPINDIRKNITGGVVIKEENMKRIFYKKNKPFIEIEYSKNDARNDAKNDARNDVFQSKIHFKNLERKYEYIIE